MPMCIDVSIGIGLSSVMARWVGRVGSQGGCGVERLVRVVVLRMQLVSSRRSVLLLSWVVLEVVRRR